MGDEFKAYENVRNDLKRFPYRRLFDRSRTRARMSSRTSIRSVSEVIVNGKLALHEGRVTAERR